MYTRVYNRYINRIDIINTNDLYFSEKGNLTGKKEDRGLVSKPRDVCTTIQHISRRHRHIQVQAKTPGV